MSELRPDPAFEQWATAQGFRLDTSHDGTYVFQPAFYAWLGWQRGELPDAAPDHRAIAEDLAGALRIASLHLMVRPHMRMPDAEENLKAILAAALARAREAGIK